MHERSRAVAVLRQARDILLDRLTDSVVEGKDSILEDAIGTCHNGEIASIYEQVASRLHQINLMLANLPSEESQAAEAEDVEPADEPEMAPTLKLLPMSRGSSVAGLLPAKTSEGSPAFEAFTQQVFEGDLDAAGKFLANLFDIDEPRGRRCASAFAERLSQSPETLQKAMCLRRELESGSLNNALTLLWECFGLQGVESIGVLQTLRARLAPR